MTEHPTTPQANKDFSLVWLTLGSSSSWDSQILSASPFKNISCFPTNMLRQTKCKLHV